MIYSLGLAIGLTVADIDSMTLGEILDIAYYRSNQREEMEQSRPDDRRKATQADYDAF